LPVATKRAAIAIRVLAGAAIGVALLAAAARGVTWTDLRREVGTLDGRWLAAAAATIVAGQWLRAARWRVLFGSDPRPSRRDSFAILSVGYLVSNILPLRAGDPARAWLVTVRTGASAARALATVMAERVLDVLSIALLLALWIPGWGAAWLANAAARQVTSAAVAAGGVAAAAAGIVGLALAARVAPALSPLVETALLRAGAPAGRAAGAAALVDRFGQGLAVLSSARRAAAVLAWSLSVWLMGAAGYWLVMRAFGLHLPFAAAGLAVCAAALLAAVLPPTPGYAGTFELAITTALVVHGVAQATALSYSLVLHGLTVGMLVIMGLLGGAWIGAGSMEMRNLPASVLGNATGRLEGRGGR
jgi:uncharacterized membrane protein YbhN (UPF0104 family)